jgi:hypothetical protein
LRVHSCGHARGMHKGANLEFETDYGNATLPMWLRNTLLKLGTEEKGFLGCPVSGLAELDGTR